MRAWSRARVASSSSKGLTGEGGPWGSAWGLGMANGGAVIADAPPSATSRKKFRRFIAERRRSPLAFWLAALEGATFSGGWLMDMAPPGYQRNSFQQVG